MYIIYELSRVVVVAVLIESDVPTICEAMLRERATVEDCSFQGDWIQLGYIVSRELS